MKKNSDFKLFDYKWIIASVCFLMVFTTLGFCSSNKGIYVGAITEATGIPRGIFSFNDSCRYIATAAVNIFFGSLIEKFGIKKLVLTGFLSLIVSSLIYSVANVAAVFYLGGIFLGFGLSFTTTGTVSCIVNKWFKKNRGTIMGAVLAANGLGGALAAQIIYPIIYQKDNIFGYRDAYRLVALILFAVAIVVLLFLKEQPKIEEKTKITVEKKKPRGEVWSGVEFCQIKKMRLFYVTAVCIFFIGIVLSAINGVAAAHLRDVGLDANYISFVLSIHSVSLALLKFLTGFIYDKLGLRITMAICCIASIITMLSLFLLNPGASGKVYAMVYSIISSLALPLETVIIPIITGDMFGEKAFNTVLGILITVNTAGMAIGSPIINLSFDLFSSYRIAFLCCGIIMVFVTSILQILITKAHKMRENASAVTDASGSSSAICKAKDPAKMTEEMMAAVRKAYDERQENR